MTALSIDTDAATALAVAWTALADAITEAQIEIEGSIEELDIGGFDRPATRSLCEAAVSLWRLASLAGHAVAAVAAGDVFDVGVLMALAEVGDPIGFTSGRGDPRGTYTSESRGVLVASGSSDLEVGRQLVVGATADTASTPTIRPDELAITRLANGAVLVVLPGVIDLSEWMERLRAFELPPIGHSSTSHSVRDVDQGAVPSFFHTDVASNPYAQMVVEALSRNGVERGAELILVGHSYGADTVLDLAADPSFNGDGGYRVTHALAMGYDSVRQMPDVPATTDVLVLQNANDRVINAEKAIAAGRRTVSNVATSIADAIRPLGAADFAGLSARRGDGDNESDDVADGVVVFDGGSKGEGHHQDNYIEYLQHTDAPEMVAFLAGVGATATASSPPVERRASPACGSTSRTVVGTRRAVDVSVAHES